MFMTVLSQTRLAPSVDKMELVFVLINITSLTMLKVPRLWTWPTGFQPTKLVSDCWWTHLQDKGRLFWWQTVADSLTVLTSGELVITEEGDICSEETHKSKENQKMSIKAVKGVKTDSSGGVLWWARAVCLCQTCWGGVGVGEDAAEWLILFYWNLLLLCKGGKF